MDALLTTYGYFAGFREKVVQVEEFQWCYNIKASAPLSPGKSKEYVIFLHGFGARKESWLSISMNLGKNYTILIPDLPGHGSTEPLDPTKSYGPEIQVDRLQQFIVKVVPKDAVIHLIGSSMGGLFAALYSAKHPERIATLTLVAPAGITTPNHSDAVTLYHVKGKNILLAHTEKDVEVLWAYSMYRKPRLPEILYACMAFERKKALPLLQRTFEDLIQDPTILDQYLPFIQAKTLFIWGKNDRILDISALNVVKEKYTASYQIHILEECGHLVDEKEQECAELIMRFISTKHVIEH